MTTNAGAHEMSRSSIGFMKQDHTSDGMEVIKKMFTPEFRNRLDAIIQFSGLSHENIAKVVDKFIFELEGQLQEKHVNLIVEPEARVWLAEHGYDPSMGARPMARLIQDEIKKPLAEELLFGRLTAGGVVRVDVAEDQLVFDIADEPVADAPSLDDG
jgi:ATP-dependent Clp protease ATP-binding subunit ClpA